LKPKVFSFVGINIFLLVVSCSEETIPEYPHVPTEWIGQDGDFQNDFSLQSDGNETILIHKGSNLPFAGKNGEEWNEIKYYPNFRKWKIKRSQYQKIEGWVVGTSPI